MFASGDLLGQIGAAMEHVGLNRHNVGDAHAVWLINAWGAANGDLSPTSPQTAMAVSEQVKLFLMDIAPEIYVADDAAKQAKAEKLLISSALIASMQQQAAGKPLASRMLAESVRQGLSEMGIDTDRVQLTEAGFALKGN
ncbi:hypothetical protein FQV27_08570 [Paracoccus aurantiacus]|uniref:Uncharacterized protein n=1 Tax=Paracoccus aurantiacus TaxID=2599412 RepID=A0A5C6S3M3_9RHOB|nr:DUF6683 family protein [Paracoccus aurantiacus]TXB69025.1 hypothetical protein FQV27_08570 [Paracoccus aurantiacus]